MKNSLNSQLLMYILLNISLCIASVFIQIIGTDGIFLLSTSVNVLTVVFSISKIYELIKIKKTINFDYIFTLVLTLILLVVITYMNVQTLVEI